MKSAVYWWGRQPQAVAQHGPKGLRGRRSEWGTPAPGKAQCGEHEDTRTHTHGLGEVEATMTRDR
eukprot:2181544-Alexandrium_andersonii.AAC.1